MKLFGSSALALILWLVAVFPVQAGPWAPPQPVCLEAPHSYNHCIDIDLGNMPKDRRIRLEEGLSLYFIGHDFGDGRGLVRGELANGRPMLYTRYYIAQVEKWSPYPIVYFGGRIIFRSDDCEHGCP